MFQFKTNNWRAAQEAKRNGCKPFWWDPYQAFCCGCDDDTHAGDQQCSVITDDSARRGGKR
jgi:hypothetical protein